MLHRKGWSSGFRFLLVGSNSCREKFFVTFVSSPNFALALFKQIPIGWMPFFYDENPKALRPGQGYDTCNARKIGCFMIVVATSC
jgi:hypothetical protein